MEKSPQLKGACDCHVHMVATETKYPLWSRRVEDPPQGTMEYWLATYQKVQSALGLSRAIFVHSILYGPDNSITLDAAKAFGLKRAKAVCLIADDTDKPTIAKLAERNTKAVRLNYVHGGILSWEGAVRIAPVLADNDMHIEMLLHSHLHINEISTQIRKLPCPIVIDHLGWPDLSLGTNDPGFVELQRLLEARKCWIKLSAAYRLGPRSDDANAFIQSLVTANPDRCVWGTDWPHLMLGDANMPETSNLLGQFQTVLEDDDTMHKILVENPELLYGFDPRERDVHS